MEPADKPTNIWGKTTGENSEFYYYSKYKFRENMFREKFRVFFSEKIQNKSFRVFFQSFLRIWLRNIETGSRKHNNSEFFFRVLL
jgi:hypothetical protein